MKHTVEHITQAPEDGTIWVTATDSFKVGLSFSNEIVFPNNETQVTHVGEFLSMSCLCHLLRTQVTHIGEFFIAHFNVKVDNEGTIFFLDEIICGNKITSHLISYAGNCPLLYTSEYTKLN